MYYVDYRERLVFCFDKSFKEVLIKASPNLEIIKIKDSDTYNKHIRGFMNYEETENLMAMKCILEDDLEKAENLVKNLFNDKTDLAGKPYIEHLIFIKDNVETLEEKIVALLHDAIEDTPMDYRFLVFMFGTNVAQTVDLLTKDKNEDYFDYIRRIKGHYVASNVKMVDLKHNMDLSKLKNIEDKDRERVKKYEKAMRMLKGEEE